MNKKIKLALTLATIGVLVLPVAALAVTVPPGTVNASGTSVSNIQGLVTNLENLLWIVFGAVAVICFVVAGILFLTAGGTPEKVQSARTAFVYGIVGVVVGIIAYSIVAIVGSVL